MVMSSFLVNSFHCSQLITGKLETDGAAKCLPPTAFIEAPCCVLYDLCLTVESGDLYQKLDHCCLRGCAAEHQLDCNEVWNPETALRVAEGYLSCCKSTGLLAV